MPVPHVQNGRSWSHSKSLHIVITMRRHLIQLAQLLRSARQNPKYGHYHRSIQLYGQCMVPRVTAVGLQDT